MHDDKPAANFKGLFLKTMTWWQSVMRRILLNIWSTNKNWYYKKVNSSFHQCIKIKCFLGSKRLIMVEQVTYMYACMYGFGVNCPFKCALRYSIHKNNEFVCFIFANYYITPDHYLLHTDWHAIKRVLEKNKTKIKL